MRICLYTDTALPKLGGQELVVDALARQFLDLGHEPTVFAPWPRKLWTNDAALPYPVVRHPRFYSTRYLVAWYQWFLKRHYARQPFDVLHCHGIYPPAYLAALTKARLQVPVVVTSHGGDVYENNVRLRKPVLAARCVQGLRGADALIAISRFTRDSFARLCPEAAPRIVDIPNGVHLDNFAPRAQKPDGWNHEIIPGEYAVFLGRLKQRKGVDVLLQALARTPAPGKVQLVIAGGGEEDASLQRLCVQLGLAERVRFVGPVSGDARTYLLQNARFGVVPSRMWEAFPLVVLEYQACGLPTIATTVPGLVDLIHPERTGLLVPPESPDHLATALHRLFVDDEAVDRMRGAAHAEVKAYDWRVIAARHVELYERVLAQRHSSAA